MATVKPRTMPGVMELLPREQVAFQRLLAVVRRSFERFGFLPIETPVLEYVDVLLTRSGGDTEKQVYLVQSTGARSQGHEPELAMRFDLTVPLARYVAEHEHELQFPFRRYQMQRVYRGESAQKGRYREFLQCDIDVIGKDELPLYYDAEIPMVIDRTFRALGLGPFTIEINHRKVLGGFLEELGVSSPEGRSQALREVDKLDRRGREDVASRLSSGPAKLTPDQAERLLAFLEFRGPHDEVLRRLRELDVAHPGYRQGVDELTRVVEALADLEVPEESCRLNLAIARGLDYYTGTVYETFLDRHRELGSVCSGGRYENLAGHYTTSHLPGVGISIGATRLFYQLRELGLVDSGLSVVHVLVTQFESTPLKESRRLVTRLRDAGLNTELYPAAEKIGKQMKYADRGGIPFVVLMGEDERSRGTVLVKELRSGEQEELPLQRVAGVLAEKVSRLHAGATGTNP